MTNPAQHPTMFVSRAHPTHYLLSAWLMLVFLTGGWQLKAQTYYHLIAGSFDDLVPANELMETLKMKSYTPALIGPQSDQTNYRVSIFQSSSRDEVETFHRTLKRNGAGKSYWILSLGSPGVPSSVAGSQTNARLQSSGTMSSDGTGKTYHLIVGSFDDSQSATRSVQAMTGQGYEPYIIVPGGQTGKYRVSVYRSMDREEIDAYANNLRKSGRKPGWVYEEEPGTVTTFGQSMSPAANARLTSVATTPSATDGNVIYHLIVGSFQRFDQASRFRDAMLLKGYNPLVMFPETGISKTFRVSVYQSTQRERVEVFKKDLQKKEGTKGWIYAQK